MKISHVVIGDFAAVPEPGREGVDDGERWIVRNTGFIDGGVDDHIYLGQGLGEGGAVVDLEEILTWHGVS